MISLVYTTLASVFLVHLHTCSGEQCYGIPNSVSIHDTCLFLIKDKQQSWNDSKTYCENTFYDGKLAELKFNDTKQEAVKLLQKAFKDSAWIALKKPPVVETYFWTYSKRLLSKTETAQSITSNREESCVILKSTNTFQPRECDDHKNFVCETENNRLKSAENPCYPFKRFVLENENCAYNLGENLDRGEAQKTCEYYGARLMNATCSLDTGDRNSACAIFNESVYIWGSCYKLFTRTLSWKEANEECLLLNSHLAEPNQDAVNALRKAFNKALITAWLGEGHAKASDTANWSINGLTVPINDTKSTGLPNATLAWLITNASVTFISNRSESHAFICQTDAVAPRPNNYVLVMPTVLKAPGNVKARLHVTSSHLNPAVYLKVTQLCSLSASNSISHTFVIMRQLSLDLNGCLTKLTKGVFRRFVQVSSSQPVTVGIYIIHVTGKRSGLPMVLPGKMISQYKLTPWDVTLMSKIGLEALDMRSYVAEINLIQDITRMKNATFSVRNFNLSMVNGQNSSNVVLATMTTFHEVDLFPGQSYMYTSDLHSHQLTNQTNALNSTKEIDFTIDQVLPPDFLDSKYISFPSPLQSSVECNVTLNFRLQAIADETTIYVWGRNFSDSVYLETAGDVKSLQLNESEIYFFNSSKYFSVSEIHRTTTLEKETVYETLCLASLIPKSLWRDQYDYYIEAETKLFTVKIYIVVAEDLTNKLEINNNHTDLKCQPLTGIEFEVCELTLQPDENVNIHIELQGLQDTFGAYVLLYNIKTAMCNTLGVTDDPAIKIDKTYSDYIERPHYWNTASSESAPCLAINYDNCSQDHSTLVRNATELLRNKTFLDELRKEIVDHLTVPLNSTASFRRNKQSALDFRPASRAMGAVGVAILTVLFSIVCISDMVAFILFIFRHVKQKYILWKRNNAVETN